MREFSRIASLLYADVFSIMDRKIHDGDIVGKHGPGATADSLTGNGKWDMREWTQRLEEWFPYGEHIIPNWRYRFSPEDVHRWDENELDHVTMRQPKDEIPTRVIDVPKTLKTPRIIAIEPTCMQYSQQAILMPLVELLETDNLRREGFGENLVSGMIGFTDQEPNRNLARLGSLNGQLATLDLSEASDRVALMHAHALFDSQKWPHLHGAAMASRSTHAEVPGWGVISLSKFASMGSALCFPVEAMVFLAIVFLGVERSLGRQLNRKDVASFRHSVRVYGDDIIAPVDCVDHIVDCLEAYGLKVNTAKSYWTGKFRESCGGDFYDGEWVTPPRVRRDLPQRVTDASEVVSLVSFRNQMYFAGYWGTVRELDRVLQRLLNGHFPPVEEDSSLLGRHSFLPLDLNGMRLSRHTHAPMVKGYVVSAATPTSVMSGVAALRKCLQPGRNQPFEDSKHLERQGRPEIVRIKLRWRPPL